MSQWHYHQNGVQYGPVTAKQLKELAVTGHLQPMDQVCAGGDWVSAGKVAGLIHDFGDGEATVNIFWPGAGGIVNLSVAVKFDGNLLGNGSLNSGFRFSVPTTIGRHTLGVKLAFPFKPEKQCIFDIQQASVYNVCPAYSFIWSNFTGKFDVSLDGGAIQAEGAIQQQWDAERQAAQCPQCSAEWSVEFLGEKIIQVERDQESRWETDIGHTFRENANYGGLMPGSDWMRDYRPGFHDETRTQRRITVPIEIQTCQHFFQCRTCGKKWKKQFHRRIDK